MRIGVDFDNTIICYDGVFHALAVDQGLIPGSVGRAKNEVRDWLRHAGREEAWTELQGRVYGEYLARCRPFAGVLAFFAACVRSGVAVFVVSHKTCHPYLGPAYDLHGAARAWIDSVGLLETGLGPDCVHFELTKADKLRRIEALDCTHFIDDLPEFLAEPEFPDGVTRILFDPNGLHPLEDRFLRASSWAELAADLGLGPGTKEVEG